MTTEKTPAAQPVHILGNWDQTQYQALMQMVNAGCKDAIGNIAAHFKTNDMNATLIASGVIQRLGNAEQPVEAPAEAPKKGKLKGV